MNNRKVAGLGVLWAILGPWACSSPAPEERFQGATRQLRAKQYAQALAEVEKARGRLSIEQSEPWAWRFRLLKAEILIAMKGRAEQEDSSTQDAAIAALLAEPAPLGDLEVRRALLQGKRARADGDILMAERLYRQARRQADSLKHWNLLTEIEEELAKLREGDNEEDLEVLLPLAQRPFAEIDPYQLIKSLLRISYRYILLQQWGPARDWAERAAIYTQKVGNADNETLRLLNLATAQNRLGYWEAAQSNLDLAMDLARSLGNRRNLAKTYQELGNNAFFTGRYQEALALYQNAERELDDPDFIYNQFVALMEMKECARARRARARLYSSADSPLQEADSRSEVDRWQELLNQGRLHHICGEGDQAQQSYARLVREASQHSFYRLRAFMGLGMLDAEQNRPEEAKRHFESAIRLIQESGRPFSRTEDRFAVFSALMNVYRIYVHTLIEIGESQKALEVADSSRGSLLREKLQQTVVTAGTMQHFLHMASRTDAVFLFYWISDYGCQAWVLKGRKSHWVRLSVTAQDLKEQLKRHSKGMIDKLRDPGRMESGFRLSKALLEPVLEHIPSGSRVVLLLDDELHRLSFDTLPVGTRQDWHYWIQDVTLSVAPSLGQIAFSARRSSPPASDFLLVGDPDYSDPEDRLGSAALEIRSIERHLDSVGLKVTKRTRAAAHANAVLDLFKNPSARGLHVAAHAVVEPFQPLESAILLTPSGALDKLYARQILDQAPLNLNPVVLSACETSGDHTFSGEGPVGLAWAFMAAGSCDVLASVWEVPDNSTAQLMDAFYDHLAQGKTYAQALRQAKLQFIRTKPIFWGGFQHYMGCLPPDAPPD